MSDILTATCNIFFWLQVARTNWFALLCCTYLLILFTIKWKVVEGISCSKCCKLYISETGIQYSCKSIERKSIAFLKKTNFKEKACKMPVSITRMYHYALSSLSLSLSLSLSSSSSSSLSLSLSNLHTKGSIVKQPLIISGIYVGHC